MVTRFDPNLKQFLCFFILECFIKRFFRLYNCSSKKTTWILKTISIRLENRIKFVTWLFVSGALFFGGHDVESSLRMNDEMHARRRR